MQDESVRQSLFLWAVYTKQLIENHNHQETIKRNIRKVDKYLGKAGITQVRLSTNILNFYTLIYTQAGVEEMIQFDMDLTNMKNISRLTEDEE